MNRKKIGTSLTTLVVCLSIVGTAGGRIKLVTLPERVATIVRLDNPQTTLIEEERVLTLQKGLNKVDFSWKGVSIDVDSIRLRILSHPGEVTLLNVSYPPNEAALVWEISSAGPWEEKVRISYLLSNIDRLITYKAIADKAEREVDLKSFLVLRNFSGEDFDKARILLNYGETFERDIKHEETRQLLFFGKDNVPITKVWTFDARKLPWDPEKLPNKNVGIPVSYRIKNDSRGGLGKFALQPGKVRIFQNDGHESTIFLGEDNTALVPIGEKTELYIGDSRDIVVTQRKMSEKDINKRYNSPAMGGERLVLYDKDVVITAKIENFKDSRAALTMIQHIPGEWKMIDCNMKYERQNANTLKFEIELPARDNNGAALENLKMHYQQLNIRP